MANIQSRAWKDDKFLSLSDSGKVLFVFLLSHEATTPLGVIFGWKHSLLAKQMGQSWDEHKFDVALGELLEAGLVKEGTDFDLIWVPNYLKYNMPKAASALSAYETALTVIPSCCSMYETIIQKTCDLAKNESASHLRALPDCYFPNGRPEDAQPEKPKAVVKEDAKAKPGHK